MTSPQLNLRQHAPSAERNRGPILAVLERVLPAACRSGESGESGNTGTVLEIASGTGQHAVHFAQAFPQLTWQPSDADDEARASIAAWTAHSGLANVRAPLALDVREAEWGIDAADAMVCINMIHISPWASAQGLIAGAQRLLPPGGVLVLYGPYRRGGAHTADSNAAFDQQLRQRNPEWGVRDMEDVVALADAAGFACDEPIAMPANNFMLVFRKR
jgi:SAM-dependent methyltransferase